MLLGSEGLSIKGADFVLDEAIIQNQPGAVLSKKQKGCLGLGGSTISSQVVLQRAMGSVIQTPGRIQIEANTGVFQATLFGDENGNKKVAEFEISDLDCDSFLRAVEAENQSRTQALNASLVEQARTSKRKATQSTTCLLISLPIVYYTGGFLSKYLAGAMGVTLSTATVAGTATTVQTATIVGLSGAGAAVAGAVVQGNNPIEAAANGAFYAWLGNVVANASVLKKSAQITQAVARSTVVATAQTVIKGGNLLENVAVAGAAAAVATTVFPGDPRDLSLTANIAKNMLEAAVVTVASNGSLEALAVNSANAGLGAMIGDSASDLGGRHGARAANALHPIARSNAQPTAASLSSSVSGASSSTRAAGATPQNPQPTRRTGLVGSNFECELNAAHQSARNLFFDAEMEHSFNHTTRGFGRMQAESNAFETKDLFDTQPVLLWSAPNRANKAERLHIGTRVLGGVTALGGAAQVVAGVAVATISAPTGVGPIVGTAIGGMGIDNVVAGIHTLWTGESQATRLFHVINAFGKQTGWYDSEGAANAELVLNLGTCIAPTGPILLSYRSGVGIARPGVGAFSGLREFASERMFRSPIVLEYDPNRLYSGVPLDLFKLRMPWVKKDVLSEKARLYPSPLFKHEEAIIARWTVERLRLLKQWKAQDLSMVNEKMYRFLDKCYSQLRDHMTPDDLAAIMKEQRGVKIPKIKGGTFDHINKELDQVQNSFRNAFHGSWSGNSAETQILNERFGELSRLWDRFEKLAERAKCNPEKKKLKN